MIFPLVLLGGFGLPIGSFLNVVVHRVPLGQSVVSPASACPKCGAGISARDNVPLLSWLLLRGACRHCGAPISARYPLVELITGIAFLLAALRFVPPVLAAGTGAARVAAGLELVAFLYLAAISVALAAIDLDVRRLPNTIVLPAYAVGGVLLGAADLLRGDLGAIGTAAAGAGASVALYLALAMVKSGGMGAGDVKLAGVLGLFLGQLGVGPLLVGTFVAFLLGAVFGVALILGGRGTRRSTIPFGPWMLAGTWTGVLLGAPLTALYLGSMGLS